MSVSESHPVKVARFEGTFYHVTELHASSSLSQSQGVDDAGWRYFDLQQ